MIIITLLTDFGLLDGYPGIMKRVIYKINPHIVHVDHFGNMATNIRKEILPATGKIIIEIAGQVIDKLSTNYVIWR